jgi:hypothetical protein
MKNEWKYRKAGVVFGLTMVVFISTLLLVAYISEPIIDNEVITEKRKVLQRIYPILPVGDASLADGATKVMYIMHYPHQAVPGTAYQSNLSNDSALGGAYEFYDYLNNEMTNETPHSTAFDVVIKMGINTSHGYNQSTGQWEATLFNATFHGVTGYNFTTDVAAVEVKIGHEASWGYWHFIIQDADGGGGNGFQIGQGVSTNMTFDFWAYE